MGTRPISGVRLGDPITTIVGSFGDKWCPAWMPDDSLVVVNGDGCGFHGDPGGNISVGRLTGDAPSRLTPEPLATLEEYDELFSVHPDQAGWRATGIASIDGVLFAFVTGRLLPAEPRPDGRIVFFDAGIVRSDDGGHTWSPKPEAVRGAPMFPGQAFAAPYFVAYGRDGAASVDGADRFVYATSNDGYFDNGDRVILGRVARDRLGACDAADWRFYAGGDGAGEESWGAIEDAMPIIAKPGAFGIAGVTHIPSLGRYVLPAWRYANPGPAFTTVLEFFEAPHPWGPWTSVAEIETGDVGWYAPSVAARFQEPINEDTVRCVLFTSGNPTEPGMLRLTLLPVEFTTQ